MRRDISEAGYDRWVWSFHPEAVEDGINPFLSEGQRVHLPSYWLVRDLIQRRAESGERAWSYVELVELAQIHEAKLTNGIAQVKSEGIIEGPGVILCEPGPMAQLPRDYIVHAFWLPSTEAEYRAAIDAMLRRMAARGLLKFNAESPRRSLRFDSRNLRADVWDKTHGRCWYCGVHMHPFRNYHIDHVIPRVDGGSDDLANLVPACEACNTRKGDRPAEFLRRYFGDGKFWAEREGIA